MSSSDEICAAMQRRSELMRLCTQSPVEMASQIIEIVEDNRLMLVQLKYLRDCIECGTDPEMSEVNALIRRIEGSK